jgi:hypothetical protein
MATDLEVARRRAQKKLDWLQDQFNALPVQMRQVQEDIARLDEAIQASKTQVDASDLVTKYSTQ